MSIARTLFLPRRCLETMLRQARAELPNECCGVLGGTASEHELHVEECYALVNEAASRIEYRSDPHSMLKACRAMDAAGWVIVGVYHSHPTSEPIPSKTDIARYDGLDAVQFIIGLKDMEPQVRGWWLSESGFTEADWRVVG